MSCDGRTLKACFHGAADIILPLSQFRLQPNCSTAEFYLDDEAGVCLELDMADCPRASTKVCCLVSITTYTM